MKTENGLARSNVKQMYHTIFFCNLIENMGSEILVHVKINNSTFRSVLSRSHKLKIGDSINLKPKLGQVHLFNKDGKVIRDE